MNYSLGDSLADTGFAFLEKLHSPIFLVHKNGTLKRVNEAGRKWLSITKMDKKILDARLLGLLGLQRSPSQGDCQRIQTCCKQIKVISKSLPSCDYVMIELLRSLKAD